VTQFRRHFRQLLVMSAYGPSLTSRDDRSMVDIEGKTDIFLREFACEPALGQYRTELGRYSLREVAPHSDGVMQCNIRERKPKMVCGLERTMSLPLAADYMDQAWTSRYLTQSVPSKASRIHFKRSALFISVVLYVSGARC
jgi:hypothetical protein